MPVVGDTIVALSSGRPPAAIAVVRLSGPGARTSVETLARHAPLPRVASLRTLVDPGSGESLDEALVLFFPGPASATGEDVAEFHCHGGRATVDAVIRSLLTVEGVRLAEAGEFTRRALINGRLDLTEAEGLADLLAAETEVQRQSALLRAGGALRRQIDELRDNILQLSARAEVAIDYADEEDGVAADDSLARDLETLREQMRTVASAPRVEPLRDGVRVVFAGPPNAGKSSLINAISKSERSIVTDIAGTTRDVIEVPIAIGGIPFVLVDTAGLRASEDPVESIGVDRAQQQIGAADIVLWMGDADSQPEGERVVQLLAKCDVTSTRPGRSGMPVSATTGEGIDQLTQLLVDRASQLLPAGDVLALDRRQHELLADALAAVDRASTTRDPVLLAEELRVARSALDRITGASGIDDLLDALFGKFCLGK